MSISDSANSAIAMNVSSFNQIPQDMLRAIPAVTDKVARALTLEVDNLQDLANLDESALAKLVGLEVARQIHRFFNRSLFD